MVTIINLATNPSWETATSGWSASNCTHAISTDWALSGTRSNKLTVTVAGPVGVFANYIIPAVAHVVSFYAYHTMGADRTAYVRYNGTNGSNFTVPSGVPTRVWRTFIGSGDSKSVLPTFGNGVIADVLYIDGLMIHTGTVPIDYFDGSSAGAAWTGTAHASTSVLTIPDVSTVLNLGSLHIGPLKVGQGD